MNVNLKGAAINTYDGIKEIIDIAEQPDDYASAEEMAEAIMEVATKCQPQLGAYCLLEHFQSQQSKPVPDIAKAIEMADEALAFELGGEGSGTLSTEARKQLAIARDLLANSPNLEDEPLWCVVGPKGINGINANWGEDYCKMMAAKFGSECKAIRVWREKE